MISTIFLKSARILFSAILQLAYEQQQMSNSKKKKLDWGIQKFLVKRRRISFVA